MAGPHSFESSRCGSAVMAGAWAATAATAAKLYHAAAVKVARLVITTVAAPGCSSTPLLHSIIANMACVFVTAVLCAVHPGIADSTWYLKSDDAYTFSWIVSKIRSVAPWVGCGQPVKSGAISSIYVSACDITTCQVVHEAAARCDMACLDSDLHQSLIHCMSTFIMPQVTQAGLYFA